MDSNGQILFFPEKEYQGTVEEVKQEMIDYVHNKYPDLEFKVLSFEPRQFAHSNYEIMWVAPDATNPDIYFSVYRYSKKDIRDEYIYLFMSEKYQNRIQSLLDHYIQGGKCILSFFAPCTPPQNFMPNMDSEDFIQWGFTTKSISVNCSIYLDADSFEEINQSSIATIQKELEQLGPDGVVSYIGCSREDIQKVKDSEGTRFSAIIVEKFKQKKGWGKFETG